MENHKGHQKTIELNSKLCEIVTEVYEASFDGTEQELKDAITTAKEILDDIKLNYNDTNRK